MNKKTIIYAVLVVAAIALVAFAVFRSGGGNGGQWICTGSQWVRVGSPSAPEPQTPCVGDRAQSATGGPGSIAAKSVNVNFTETGVVVSEDDAPVGWKFTYGGSSVHLFFVSASICNLGKGPAPCGGKSSMNIVGSTVKIEGEKDGDKVIVAKLTWVK